MCLCEECRPASPEGKGSPDLDEHVAIEERLHVLTRHRDDLSQRLDAVDEERDRLLRSLRLTVTPRPRRPGSSSTQTSGKN